jgi:hypothetical protein
MPLYDNLFTSNIYDNSNLNTTNTLNVKYWKTFETDRVIPSIYSKGKTQGSFFKIYTLSQEDSTLLKTSINDSSRAVYFDINGHIKIDNGRTQLFLKKNPLVKNDFNVNSRLEITQSKIPRLDFFMTQNKKWIMYYDNSLYHLLYNPIHRSSFRDFYAVQNVSNDGLTVADQNYNGGDMKNLMTKYCEIIAEKNTTTGNRKFADETCKCMMGIRGDSSSTEQDSECVDSAMTYHSTSSAARSKIGSLCRCLAKTECSDLNGEVVKLDNDSFFKKLPTSSTTPRDFLSKIEKLDPCPSALNITVCDANVSSAGGIKGNANITQNCGSGDLPSTTAPPTTTPYVQPTTTLPPTTTPYVQPTTTLLPTTTPYVQPTTTLLPTTTPYVQPTTTLPPPTTIPYVQPTTTLKPTTIPYVQPTTTLKPTTIPYVQPTTTLKPTTTTLKPTTTTLKPTTTTLKPTTTTVKPTTTTVKPSSGFACTIL